MCVVNIFNRYKHIETIFNYKPNINNYAQDEKL